MLIQKIVKEISLELRYIDLSVDPKLVGMKERVQDVVSYLQTDIDDVRMIGIKGMGGGGKTTLCKAVFDQISDLYEGSSFVENVRESTKVHGLKSLQKQVLSDVLNDPSINVSGPDLKRMMQKKMKCRKVLVVLDDVDRIDQLEALAGETNWFKPGSRVIITTREEQVLVAHRVPKNMILDVNLLSHEEASCLFNRYAFGRENPDHGFEMLSNKFICYAVGLPLTIKVLGSLLCGRDELEWEDELKRLQTIPLMETLRILELSYNSLEEDRKEIFLDVACILKGWEKETAIRALESRGFYARSGLKDLEQKSLLTVSDSGCLSMHDHIEEMGKNIVQRLHPNEPHKHSRLWIKEEVNNILIEDKGTEATRCISVSKASLLVIMDGLRKMKDLRFLQFVMDYNRKYAYIGEDYLYLPDSLQYLDWNGYAYTCLPKSFQANNLVGLKMRDSLIEQLWNGGERKDLKKLRFIDFENCKLRTLDIGLFLNLERLNLDKCEQLVELYMPVESFKLKFFRLCLCKLKTLDLTWADNLETLTVVHCRNLVELRVPVNSFGLKFLSLHDCQLKTLDLTQADNLETLTVEHCWNLVELRMHVESFKLKFLTLRNCKLKTLDLKRAQNLDTLHVAKCEDLVELHMPNESLKLKDLSLKYCKVKTLNLICALNLVKLDASECEDLEELHLPVSVKLESLNLCHSMLKTVDLVGALNLEILTIEKCDCMLELHMPAESLMLQRLYLQCSKLKTLNLQRALNLESVDLRGCEELEDLDMPAECFNLDYLFVCNSKLKTLNLSGALNLIKLQIEKCHNLVELHMPVESLMLEDLSLQCFKLKTLNLGASPSLRRLGLGYLNDRFQINSSDCVRFNPLANQVSTMVLAELHLAARSLGIECQWHLDQCFKFLREDGTDLHGLRFAGVYEDPLPSLITGNLEKLISIDLCTCTSLTSFVRSICGLQYLRRLTLEGSIPEVPKQVNQLERLEELNLLSMNIEHLPDSICMLRRLKVLWLKFCVLLEQLPEDLGRLECLEELNLKECKSLKYIPNSICAMQCLKSFHLTSCILVEKLPEEIGRLRCLKELNIECTPIIDLPQSIFQLKGLLIIGSSAQLKTYGITSEKKNSNNLALGYI